MAIYKLDDLLKKHNVTEDQVTTYGSPQSIQNSLNQLQKPKEEQSFLGSLKEDLNTRVDRTGAILNRPDSSTLEKGTQLFGQGAGLAANAIEKTAEQIPGVKQAFGAVGAGINWLAESAPIKAIANQIGESKTLQEVTNLYDTDQNFKDSVDAVANIVRLGGDVQMAQDAVNFTKNVTNKIADKVKTSLPPGGGGGAISNVSENALKAGTELKNNVQLSIAKKNVNPQLESSANRLFLDGTKNLENPIATYDNYLAQSKKALGDIKADPAISTVGEKMGNAFETVVKQRQAVGKVLGEELKANGSVKVSIVEPKTNLLNDLKESGLSYNPKTNRLTSFQGSKFAPEEVKMLNNFVKDIIKLGDSPSVSQIDNFIAKTRSTLEFTKGKSGVMGTTNAERIIKGGISKLRETLNPTVNGNNALSKYWNANKTYSELSDFVDEGSTFLGKKTLSGDFAKDASVAKSSVQSILNQGKKDFMLKLEALTGYKAIDDAVLALQAMKDAGDFRGLSLLQAMSETGIPTSKAGFTQKVLDYAMEKGGKILAGTPEEQTRAFLQDLSNKAKTPSIKNKPSKTPPKTGAKINKSVQPKSSETVISPKSTTKSLKVKGEIPPTKIREVTPDATLIGEDAKIQNASIAKYKANAKQLTQDYIKKNGKVVNTDEARKLFKDVGYKGSNSAAVQEASSALAKDAWEYLLRTSRGNDSLLYAGGSGTGKTSAVKNILPKEVADAGAILDGNLSTLKSANARIEESIKAGKYPNIVYVYREPVDSWVNGVIKRMTGNADEGGRVVPLSVFLQNHEGSYNVVKNLLNDSANGIKYDVKMVDNSLGRGNQSLLSREKFDNIKYQSNLKQELLAKTKELYENGTITKEEYQALIK